MSNQAHPLEHHPAFRAVIAAAPPIAEFAPDLVERLALACSDLAHGFAAPPGSKRRIEAHKRAWSSVRSIDRVVAEAARLRDPKKRTVVQKARRAIDKADVLISTLPGVLSI